MTVHSNVKNSSVTAKYIQNRIKSRQTGTNQEEREIYSKSMDLLTSGTSIILQDEFQKPQKLELVVLKAGDLKV